MDPATLSVVAGELIKQGVTGAFLLLCVGVIVALWKALNASNAARLTDARADTDRYVALLQKMMESQNDTNTILKIIEDRARSSSPGKRG